MTDALRNVHLTGWGYYAPSAVLTNADLERLVDTSDEWIVTRTGIRERRIAGPAETTASMATVAKHASNNFFMRSPHHFLFARPRDQDWSWGDECQIVFDFR